MYVIGEEEIEAVRRVFQRKKLFRYQRDEGECDSFEREFAEKVGGRHAIILSSGTNALIAAFRACGIKTGDEVIIPAYTFVATAAAVLNVGAIPVVANVDEELGLDPSDVKAKITPRTRAIVPVHMDGLASNLEGLLGLCREHGLAMVEDVAQAIGGSYDGTGLGTFGDFGCFSLNENKTISCGEGGILITGRRDLYERAFSFHDVSAQFNPVRKELFAEPQVVAGSSMRVSEVLGAIMRVQLQRLDGIISGLRERKKLLMAELAGISEIRVVQGHCAEGGCGSSLHLVFQDPASALSFGREFRAAEIPFLPVIMRPAHVCWKWAPVFNAKATDYLSSLDLLSRTLKLDIDLSLTTEQTERLGRRIAKLLHHEIPGGE